MKHKHIYDVTVKHPSDNAVIMLCTDEIRAARLSVRAYLNAAGLPYAHIHGKCQVCGHEIISAVRDSAHKHIAVATATRG